MKNQIVPVSEALTGIGRATAKCLWGMSEALTGIHFKLYPKETTRSTQ